MLLIGLACDLGWDEVNVKGIYSYNERSIGIFTSLGFVETGRNTNSEGVTEISFTLQLKKGPTEQRNSREAL